MRPDRGAAAAAVHPAIGAALLLVGVSGAMVLRLAVSGGPRVPSAPAGLAFAAALLGLAAAAGWRPARLSPSSLAVGLAGGAVLCAAPMALRLVGQPRPIPSAEGFVVWAAVVGLVAVAQEVLLRGALIDAVRPCAGDGAAVGLAAVAFGLLHVPLYGWGAVPLDVAVGVWLGGLRLLSGGVAAPAAAHTVADWAAWWLR